MATFGVFPYPPLTPGQVQAKWGVVPQSSKPIKNEVYQAVYNKLYGASKYETQANLPLQPPELPTGVPQMISLPLDRRRGGPIRLSAEAVQLAMSQAPEATIDSWRRKQGLSERWKPEVGCKCQPCQVWEAAQAAQKSPQSEDQPKKTPPPLTYKGMSWGNYPSKSSVMVVSPSIKDAYLKLLIQDTKESLEGPSYYMTPPASLMPNEPPVETKPPIGFDPIEDTEDEDEPEDDYYDESETDCDCSECRAERGEDA